MKFKRKPNKPRTTIGIISEAVGCVLASLSIGFVLSFLPLEIESYWAGNYLPLFDKTLTTFVCEKEIVSRGYKLRDYNVLCGKPTGLLAGITPEKSKITFLYHTVVTLYFAFILSAVFLALYGLSWVIREIRRVT